MVRVMREGAMKQFFSVDRAVSYQENHWKERRHSVEIKGKNPPPFLTISREYGCMGYGVGEAVARIFSDERSMRPRWMVYDRHVLDSLMEDMEISYELAETLTDRAKSSMADYFRIIFSSYPPEAVIYKKLVETIRIIAANGHAVIIGRVSNVITRDLPRGFHVRLLASQARRIENIAAMRSVTSKEARNILEQKGVEREQFVLKHLKVNIADPSLYDVIINTTRRTVEETARLIVRAMEHAEIVAPKP
jgi:hypothetical protein